MDHIISNHSLFIDSEFEQFINLFCSTTGQNFPQGKLGNYLGSWYEGYIFCLILGINSNNRYYDGYISKYQKMPNWSNQNLSQYKYCIARVISRPDIILELGLDSRENINSKFVSIEDLLNKVKVICDQFSLGGVRLLKKYHENDPYIFDDPFALKLILDKSLNSK